VVVLGADPNNLTQSSAYAETNDAIPASSSGVASATGNHKRYCALRPLFHRSVTSLAGIEYLRLEPISCHNDIRHRLHQLLWKPAKDT
jgi:hypothetical protein